MVHALRRKDIVNAEGAPIVLFRNNDYREIKSDAGIRQVPLIGPMLAEERQALSVWMEHIGEFADDDSLAAIFADTSQPRELIDRRAICDRITEALRVVTGSPKVRLHYGRHAFGTRCEWLMTLERLPRNTEISRVIRRIIGPADPREARALLLDTTEPSKRGAWAVSLAIGHGWPGTTFRCYTHTSDLLAALYLDDVFKQAAITLDLPTAAYAAGLAVSEAERLRTGSGERTGLSEDAARILSQRQIHSCRNPLFATRIRTCPAAETEGCAGPPDPRAHRPRARSCASPAPGRRAGANAVSPRSAHPAAARRRVHGAQRSSL